MRNYAEMMDLVVSRFGLEDETVIKFCSMCETAKTADDDRKIENAFVRLMSCGLDDDDDYDYDECGFPYEGRYDDGC